MSAHPVANRGRHRKGNRQERIIAAIQSARRYYDLHALSLEALVDLYGQLRKLMPKLNMDGEFRAAAKIQREFYRNSLRRARKERAIVKRFKKVVLPNN
jgi:hypothetical protein